VKQTGFPRDNLKQDFLVKDPPIFDVDSIFHPTVGQNQLQVDLFAFHFLILDLYYRLEWVSTCMPVSFYFCHFNWSKTLSAIFRFSPNSSLYNQFKGNAEILTTVNKGDQNKELPRSNQKSWTEYKSPDGAPRL
jgi:hypothetical protein